MTLLVCQKIKPLPFCRDKAARAVNILCKVDGDESVGIIFKFHPYPTKIHLNCKKYA